MLRTLLSVVLLIFLNAAFTSAVNAQGLAERRAIKEYQDKKYPELKKQVAAAAGFDVKTTVHWDKLALPGQAEHYLEDEYITWIFFSPLIEALKSITKDDMGKAALKDKLKEILITYDAATAPISNYKDGWKFENGILTINYQPWVNTGGPDTNEFKDRTKAIRENLEEKL
jgi:hypothetical protein